MGYDLCGRKFTSKAGEYFRNNIWWWHQLANYVASVTGLNDEMWHDNSGHWVKKKEADLIWKTLNNLHKKGEIHKYARKYKAQDKKAPKEVDCNWCNATGVDIDGSGIKKECTWCHGTKKIANYDKGRPFTVTNVMQFAKFCKDSGGFNIC